MNPGVYPLQVYRGDTQTWQFVLWQDPAKTVPVDLSGAVAKSQIRNRPGGLLRVDLGTAIELPNKVDMSLASAASLTLEAGIWAWDLQLTYAGGNVQTVLAGPVPVTPDVTE